MQNNIKNWKENILESIFSKKETNNIVRILSESLNKSVFIINKDSKVVYINTKAKKYFKILNYTNDEIEKFYPDFDTSLHIKH